MVVVEGIEKSYGDAPALRGVDLTVQRGEVVALLGPNGAGKSTLVSIIAGGLDADAGRVTFDGRPVDTTSIEVRRSIGVAPQDLAVYPTLSVRHNLEMVGGMYGVGRREMDAVIQEAAEALDLDHLLDRAVSTLSGGEKRRVHTAGALLHRPDLLLLDEPTAGVDPATRTRLIDWIKNLASQGIGILYSTHYLGEVSALGARIVVLDKGLVVAEGTEDEIMALQGAPTLEVSFDGPAPPVAGAIAAGDPSTLQIAAAEPALRVRDLVDSLDDADLARVTTIRTSGRSLEDVFLRLTSADEVPVEAR